MQRRSTSLDISWFIDLRRHEQLDLNPPYQRRSVWTLKDRRFFLDTIFRGYPCPPIFLHKIQGSDQQTGYAVVDGKQRLQTIFKFSDGEISLAEDFGDERFNGKTWGTLGQSERQIFWDYVIPVEFLTFDPTDTKAVNNAFDRLNRNMRKLEPQELRHARWDGWFIALVERECDDPIWRKLGIVTNARAKRMKDAQFISELLLIVIEQRQVGFDQNLLDDAYANYDDPEESDPPINPDEVIEKLAVVKEYIAAVQETNGCVKEYASTFAAFYTLWAFVALPNANDLPPDQFATKFKEFMRMVYELDSTPDKAAMLAPPGGLQFRRPSEFLDAFKGASTDLGPRTNRLSALRTYIRGE